MKQNGKILGLTFLWLAGLIILLHAVIPHHHHYAAGGHCFPDTQQKHTLVSHVDHNCHAFNELISEDKSSLSQKIQKQAFLTFNYFILSEQSNKPGETKTFFLFSFRDNLKNLLLLRVCQPVRGSPVV